MKKMTAKNAGADLSAETSVLIGKMITQMRKKRGISQAALAVLAGCSISQLRRLENGSGTVSMRICLQIAAALGVSLAEMIRETEMTLRK